MRNCEVYQLLDYLESMEIPEDISISANEINKLGESLRERRIKPLFDYSSFEKAAKEYPSILTVSESKITFFRNKESVRRIVYFDSDSEVRSTIENIWAHKMRKKY